MEHGAHFLILYYPFWIVRLYRYGWEEQVRTPVERAAGSHTNDSDDERGDADDSSTSTGGGEGDFEARLEQALHAHFTTPRLLALGDLLVLLLAPTPTVPRRWGDDRPRASETVHLEVQPALHLLRASQPPPSCPLAQVTALSSRDGTSALVSRVHTRLVLQGSVSAMLPPGLLQYARCMANTAEASTAGFEAAPATTSSSAAVARILTPCVHAAGAALRVRASLLLQGPLGAAHPRPPARRQLGFLGLRTAGGSV